MTSKNAVILHGTDATPESNWFPWLAEQLESLGVHTVVPQLPGADKPSIERYNKFLLAGEFEFNEETILIGHSSGAVEVLGLLPQLHSPVAASFLVSAFENDLGWPALAELFSQPLDFKHITRNGGEMVFIHSDNDPFVPLEQAEHLAKATGARLVVLPGQGHFSAGLDPRYNTFEKLLEQIKEIL